MRWSRRSWLGVARTEKSLRGGFSLGGPASATSAFPLVRTPRRYSSAGPRSCAMYEQCLRRTVRRMEASMTRLLVLTIAALHMLVLHGTQTWGGPQNPTPSDGNGNTAGGTGTLQSVTVQGTFNTGFGFQALLNTTSGDFNTATGVGALWSNTAGVSNTATGFETL